MEICCLSIIKQLLSYNLSGAWAYTVCLRTAVLPRTALFHRLKCAMTEIMLVCTGMPHQLGFLSMTTTQACGQFFLLLSSFDLMLILFLGYFSVLHQGIISAYSDTSHGCLFWSFNLPSRTVLCGTWNSLSFNLGSCYR